MSKQKDGFILSSKRNILVTGANGFMGRHLVTQLSKNPLYQIFSYDLEQGDIATAELTFSNIDHVFHLAARTYVPDSWDNPYDFYQTNTLGAVNILDLCRKQNCSITFISSYVYGAPEYLPVDEDHPLKPYNPYSHSKIITEDICRFYGDAFKIPYTILRPFNIYGPGQRNDFLIPTIIEQVLNPSVDTVQVNDLKPKRDYLYIEDLIRVLLLTMDNPANQSFNVGSGFSVSVEQIIIDVIRIAKEHKLYVSNELVRPNEINDLFADIGKLKKVYDWSPESDLELGLTKCIKQWRCRNGRS